MTNVHDISQGRMKEIMCVVTGMRKMDHLCYVDLVKDDHRNNEQRMRSEGMKMLTRRRSVTSDFPWPCAA